MKRFLVGLLPLLAVAASAVVPSAAAAVACESQVLCNAAGVNLRDDLSEGPTGGGFGTDGLAVNTQGPLRWCEKYVSGTGCGGTTNKNPANDAFVGITLRENRAFPKTAKEKEECKEAAGREAAATGWVQWVDIQDATSTGGTSSPVYAGTSPSANGPWSLTIRSDECTTNPGRVTIGKFAAYLPVPNWILTTPTTGGLVGKYVNPGSTCAGGGAELNVEQALELNGASAARTIDDGTTGTTTKAILCFVSANNSLYPTTAPTWGPFMGAIWSSPVVPSSEEGYGCSNPGEPNIQQPCVGPVNAVTGNLALPQTDVLIGGRGPGLREIRTYNSQIAANQKEPGPFGFGWTGSYSAHLSIGTELVTVHQDNGSAAAFRISGTEYVPVGGWIQAILAKSGTNYIYTLPDQTKLEFNESGQLLKETDRDGNAITLTYKGGKLEKVEDGDKRTLTFTYNGTGQVETVTDPMKHVITYKYTSEQLTSVTIEGKVRWEFEYESPHLLKKIIDGDKHATTTEYEATTHRVIKQTIAGHERKFTYGTKETTLTEPNGSTTVETFNAAGEPTKIIRAKGKSEETTPEYEYEAGTYARTKLKDGNGHETLYGYDGEGNKTSEKDPNGDERKWKYDKTHDIETETTPEGETTTIKRNADGDPEVIERPIGSEVQKTKYVYDAKGDVEEEINPLGDTTKYTYDAAGDKEIEKDPEGNERKWKYNEDSQETEETSPRKFTTITERDERGLPVKITDPLKHTTEYTYDGNGNVESETDGNKHTTKYEYDEENLPIKVEEANGDHTETEYDSEGKMTVHKDGNGHKWEYKRNQLEQVTEEVNPLSKVTKKKYDKAGNLETLETPDTEKTTYKYDESNRLKEITYSTGKPSTVTYEYNKDSKVTEMTDQTGTTKNTYDKLDRLTESENGAKKVVKYKYDLANLPTAITYPNKKEIKREYDKDARLEKITDWNSKTSSFKYNPDSEFEKTAFPSGTEDEDTYGYNEADEMTEVKYKGPAGASLGTLAYTRGGDGEVTKTTTTVLPGPASNEDK